MNRQLMTLVSVVSALLLSVLPSLGQAQKMSDLEPSDTPAQADQSSRPEPVVEQIGDWNRICEPSGSRCAMTQVGKDPNGAPAIEFVVRKVDDKEAEINGIQVKAVADIITPLGVLLEFGVRLRIDDQEERAAPFRICQQHGCLVREPLSDDVLAAMKKGNKAIVVVAAEGPGPIEIPISLKGFTKAYDSL